MTQSRFKLVRPLLPGRRYELCGQDPKTTDTQGSMPKIQIITIGDDAVKLGLVVLWFAQSSLFVFP